MCAKDGGENQINGMPCSVFASAEGAGKVIKPRGLRSGGEEGEMGRRRVREAEQGEK